MDEKQATGHIPRFQTQDYRCLRSSRLQMKAMRAAQKLQCNANLSSQEKKSARRILKEASQMACPRMAHGGCSTRSCPFLHAPPQQLTITGPRELRGIIRMYKPEHGYGFIRGDGGYEDHYFHDGSKDYYVGQAVSFVSTPAPEYGKAPVATTLEDISDEYH